MSTIIDALKQKELYDHPVDYFKVVETYTSWILLTGQFAYKIKKPVDFQFLDYSSLEKRLQNYEREITLNRELAPDLYLELIKIGRHDQNPEQVQFNHDAAAIEYTIKMREFPQSDLFDHRLNAQKLTATDIAAVAQVIARFHQQTTVTPPDSRFGTPHEVLAPVQQNFDQIRPLLTEDKDLAELTQLESWANAEFKRLLPVFEQRKTQGFIRSCHGDLHLGNIVMLDGQATLFDRIEFNEEFRFTDTMADLGFLVMDLEDRQRFDFAYELINHYLQDSGDYQGLNVLPFYIAYRAMVRAKVALFSLLQPHLTAEAKANIRQEYLRRTQLALRYVTPQQPRLFITHGLSGSGKSTCASRLVSEFGFIQLRSDVERKRMHGLPSHADTQAPVQSGLYQPAITEQVYQHLLALAQIVMTAGYTPLIDATFLLQAQRQPFSELARQLKVPFLILHINPPINQTVAWLETRLATSPAQSISNANQAVLAQQQQQQEALTAQEQSHTIVIDSSDPQGITHAIQQIKQSIYA